MRFWRCPSRDETTASLRHQGNGRFLLTGELNFAGVAGLLRQSTDLFANPTPTVELDLAGVQRVDSAGLALLVEWLARARRLGKSLRFLHVPEQILRMAKVGGLETILPFG